MPHEPAELNETGANSDPERAAQGEDPLALPALSEQARRHAAGLAPGAGAPAVRAVAGDGRDRRAARDHGGRGARHDELLRLLSRRHPIGDVRVWICRSLSCMLRGGDEMLEHACHKLGIEPGETTAGGELTVEFAECLGICDFAPAALADDGRVFGPLDAGSGRSDARRTGCPTE